MCLMNERFDATTVLIAVAVIIFFYLMYEIKESQNTQARVVEYNALKRELGNKSGVDIPVSVFLR